MAKKGSRGKAKDTPRPQESRPEPPPASAVRSYKDEAAEEAFRSLPGRVDETLAVVRYTGRKRIYIHYGVAGDGSAFSYLIFSDGHRSLAVYPPDQREQCFADLLGMMNGWLASVNSDPRSPSYCVICPDVDVVEQVMRTRYLEADPS
jgi:hypothetical protein